MGTNLEELKQRLCRLERKNEQEVLTLIEVLSNAAFFGDLKKASCEFAENGQCGFFILEPQAKNKIPIISDCHISECEELGAHCHIELSDITCAFCQQLSDEQKFSLQVKSFKNGDLLKERYWVDLRK
jgi:hypothetical protein